MEVSENRATGAESSDVIRAERERQNCKMGIAIETITMATTACLSCSDAR